MSHIVGIPTTRVSSLFVSQRLLSQTQNDQISLLQLQNQLSTGYRFELPGEDPGSAMRVISLQGLLERKTQIQTNVSTNQSYLTATDSTLSSVSSLLADIRGVALGVMGTTASDSERQAAAEEVNEAIKQLVETGNTLFRGRYLFGGSTTGVRPFEIVGANLVRYLGNDTKLSSYSGLDALFTTNVTGDEVFGAISEAVRGTADLDPILTVSTRLTDLRGGDGISPGSIEISNGSARSTIDLTDAKTIGDVARLIRNNPPAGSIVEVEVTTTGLKIALDSGNLSIREVGAGTTAKELGILCNSTGPGPVVGDDLDPVLRLTTRLDDVLGVRASAVVHSAGFDNDLIVEANRHGTSLDGVTVTYVDDGSVTKAGEEVVTYDSGTHTLQVNIKSGRTEARHVVEAINAAYDETTSPFTATLDPLDDRKGGRGFVDVTATAVTDGGSGFDFDQESGLQIVNAGATYTVTFSKADGVETIEDMLNVINGCGAEVVASINEEGTGIDIRSRISGADLAIGENGGTTAAELGVRTMIANTRLEDLNYGQGVDDLDGNATVATATKTSLGSNNDLLFTARNTGPEWNGFSIEFVEQVPAGAETLDYDPVAKTMVFSVNPGTTTAADIVQLFNATAGARDDFEISLPDEGEQGNNGNGYVLSSTASSVVASWVGDNNDLLFQARNSGAEWDGFTVRFEAGVPAGTEDFDYDPVAKTMVFQIDPGVTTANRVVELFETDPQAVADFLVAPVPESGAANNGGGAVWPAPDITTAGGSIEAASTTASGVTAGADFIITRSDGVSFEVDLTGAETIGDVLYRINHNADNLGSGVPIVARLAASGNGIELVDGNGGGQPLTVTRAESSTAAIDLGLIPAGQESATGTTVGGDQVLTGRDTNPQETEGIFTALTRLYEGILAGDNWEIQRSIDMLDQSVQQLNLTRGEVGIRQQGLDSLLERMGVEEVELKASLSAEHDADFVETLSNLTAKQTAYQAALMSSAQTLQMSLLNYL